MDSVILAPCALHNILGPVGMPFIDNLQAENHFTKEADNIINFRRTGDRPATIELHIRETFKNNFNSEAEPWQKEIERRGRFH